MTNRSLARLLRALPVTLAVVTGLASAPPAARAGWEPDAPVTLIVPAGTGGGADQMARLIQRIASAHKLLRQPLTVVNRTDRSGAEGFLEVKAARGDPHKLIISLSNIFTTPMSTAIAFEWTDLTPVAMLALDPFVLWVAAGTPYQNASDFLAQVKASSETTFRMGGTGVAQEDQVLTVALQAFTRPRRFEYVAFPSGGAVAKALAETRVDSTVNNPIEAVEAWRAGKVRPLCVLDAKRLAGATKVAGKLAWSDIPTCRESGIDVRYQMMRGILMSPGVALEAVAYYESLLAKVVKTQEWQHYIANGALIESFLTGPAFRSWLAAADDQHYELMRAGGLLAPFKFRFLKPPAKP